MSLFGSKAPTESVAKKTWTVTGIVILCLLVAGVFVYTFNISLLLLAGVVLAVYLRLVADKLKQWTGWKDMVCYILSIVITFVALTALGWLIGAKVQDQAEQLEKRLPEMKQQVSSVANKYPVVKRALGRYISGWDASQPGQSADSTSATATPPASDSAGVRQQSDSAASPAPAPQTNENAQPSPPGGSGGAGGGNLGSMVRQFFTSTFGFLGDLYVIFFLGLFLAATPREYVNGMVNLVPEKGQHKAREVFERMGMNLRKWFLGMTMSVLITFALTAIGLLLLGVDLWLILAILAGLLTFIPNFGPVLSLIPALMVGFLDSPEQALWIFILYFMVQMVESNIITPMIQKKMLDVPAALLLFFQMIMGALSGGWGVVMATPLLVVLMTIVQELYSGRSQGDANEEDAPPEPKEA